jgi:putative transposase
VGVHRRRLSDIRLVTSDAHPGPVDAIAARLPGASWQRWRTPFMRNTLTRVPKSAQGIVATMVRTIFDQCDAATVQHARVVDQLKPRFPEAGLCAEPPCFAACPGNATDDAPCSRLNTA